MATLELSDAATLSQWLGGESVDSLLLGSLDAAREIITARVAVDRIDPDNPPAALHRAATMLAAQLQRRQNSIYGVDAFAVGGDAGAVLVTDPTINDLIAPWRRPAVAGTTGSS